MGPDAIGGVTEPIRLANKEIEALTLATLARMTEDASFTCRRHAAPS